MTDVERLTVTLPAELAALVKGAVDSGDYASASEVVRAALGDWRLKQSRRDGLKALRADIEAGIADVEAGRVEAFDAARIVERGRKLSAARSPSD